MRVVVITSSDRQEDDGEDGEPACERERVRADEAVLRDRQLTRSEPDHTGDGGDRAADERRFHECVEPAGDEIAGPVPDQIVELVPVELLLEEPYGARH